MIYTKYKILLFFLTVFIFANTSLCQTSDFGTWSSIGIEYESNKTWTFGLEEQLRLDENSSEIEEYFTQLNSEYKINKNFRIGAGVRYISENDNEGSVQGYENYFRYHLDGTYKHNIDKLSLSYRIRYQNKNELGVSSDEGDYAKQNIRFKTTLKYNIKKWPLDPRLSAEIFNSFGEEVDNEFSKYRITLGTTYKIKNAGKIKLFYRYEKELNANFPDINNIIGLKYTFTFKNKKNKKNKSED